VRRRLGVASNSGERNKKKAQMMDPAKETGIGRVLCPFFRTRSAGKRETVFGGKGWTVISDVNIK